MKIFSQQTLYLITLLLTLSSLIIVIVTHITNDWSIGTLVRTSIYHQNLSTNSVDETLVDGDCKRFEGSINVGFFRGFVKLNYGFGCRESDVELQCSSTLCQWEQIPLTIDCEEEEKINKNYLGTSLLLLVAILLFVCIYSIFCVTSIFFSFLNIIRTPYQAMRTSFGIFLYNLAAFFALLIELCLYVAYHDTSYKKKDLTTKCDFSHKWTTKSSVVPQSTTRKPSTSLGTSFYVNIIPLILLCSTSIFMYLLWSKYLQVLKHNAKQERTAETVIVTNEKSHSNNNNFNSSENGVVENDLYY
ncbi:hypothetical protein SNEBB_004857 [Seison nebaliae]|nr:hypothetical protein SNEBB_004857 [Seison nebaliae]